MFVPKIISLFCSTPIPTQYPLDGCRNALKSHISFLSPQFDSVNTRPQCLSELIQVQDGYLKKIKKLSVASLFIKNTTTG